jgi:hypothetical protein
MRPTLRSHRAARHAFGLACGVVLLAGPAAAEAQFGKLVRRAAAAATEAAAGAAGGRAAEAAAAKTGVAVPGGRAADASRLAITPERIDAFVVAMRGPAEAARQRAANAEASKARAAAETAQREQNSTYGTCVQQHIGGRVPDLAAAQRAERFMDRFHAVNERRGKAYETGNTALGEQLADSVADAQADMQNAIYPGLTKRCGRPVRQVAAASVVAAAPVSDAAFRPAVPAGMTPIQFGVMRERVVAWLVAEGRGAALDAAERQALESRRAALAPLAPLFESRTLEWVDVGAGLDLR